jgi:hypothetical protein
VVSQSFCPKSSARDPPEQTLEFAAVDPVTPRDETDQGVSYQLGERAPGDVHDTSPGYSAPRVLFISDEQ